MIFQGLLQALSQRPLFLEWFVDKYELTYITTVVIYESLCAAFIKMEYSVSEIAMSILVVAISFIMNSIVSAVTCTLPGIFYVELLAAFPSETSGMIAMGMSLVSASTWGVGEHGCFFQSKTFKLCRD